jgi:molybdopterin converting factor small subunit
MAELRLFAGLREVAGTGRIEVEAGSVRELIEEAVARFGDEFAIRLPSARVWVNGEPADNETPITAADEVALLPPVSGGGVVAEGETEVTPTLPVLPILALAAAVLANLASREWMAVAAVGIIGLWLWDVFDEAADRGAGMVRWPALVAATGTAVAAWRWSSEGFAVAVTLSALLVLAWSVLQKSFRSVDGVGGTLLATLAGAAVTGSVVLVRAGTEGESRITAFLLMVLVANLALWAMLRVESPGFLDPHTAASLGVLIVGVVAGIVIETSLVAMVLAAAAVAASFLAGRAFGSTLRTGDLFLLQRLPGFLVPVDGAVLAFPVMWIVLAAAA